ncbi:MAG TPA: CBS domain-containing protein [Prosthecochloris aestuarii]|uniref:CBS domain-containing protein n=1 Tax=Prosthecochloris aestuarii TaxID=1102 RepID=A0A831WQX4_PROAE|nr:CBS domain-containing protein [Prosthecochloris aestuarii]
MSVIEQYIDRSYPVVQPGDTCSEVATILREAGMEDIPVVDEGRVTAIVSAKDIIACSGISRTGSARCISELGLSGCTCVPASTHVLDAFSMLVRSPFGIIPVCGPEGEYIGVVGLGRLARDICDIFHLCGEEATLELEVPAMGVNVSEIVSVMEKNDATVLGFGLRTPEPDAEGMVLTFRVLSSDLYRLVKSLEKYGYLVVYHSPFSFGENDELRDKALEFMRYIDM